MNRRRYRRSAVYVIAAVVMISVLIFAGVQALSIYIPQLNASRSFEELKREADIGDVSADELLGATEASLDGEDNADLPSGSDSIRQLSQMNSDFVGWLSIEDTVIDYPVMKSAESDPEYYLHRDFDGNDSYSGTLFIGEGCNADSDVFVIYGHNMNAGTMFGSLDSYKDFFFADQHRDIVFRTPADNRVYRVFAAFQTKIYPEGTDVFEYYRSVGSLNREAYDEVLENVRRMSLISMNDAPQYPAQIMFLSTCSYHTDEGRFVVAAYRVA